MKCRRCGERTPVLVADRCPRCEAEVRALIAADAKRRAPRCPAKDMTDWSAR